MADTSNTSPELARLVDQVRQARQDRRPLSIHGGDTKRFYGRACDGAALDTTPLSGIVSYEPSELVITARCGTPLQEIEQTLHERNQCLAFEPPHFGPASTVGGMVAAGLSGPARATRGAVRDHVLGTVMLDSNGNVLRFGGQVIKNVAGYDLSRLLCGSLGTLGVILEVSLRVAPMAAATETLCFELPAADAVDHVNRWIGQALPVDASAWHSGRLSLRLRGARAAVNDAIPRLGGERLAPDRADAYWRSLRDQTHAWFTDDARPLWRLSLPATSPTLAETASQLIEWHGAQRWLHSDLPVQEVFHLAAQAGGHATRFRGDAEPVFAPLDAGIARLHHAIKQQFDPLGIFNPGRMYPGV